MKLYDGEFQVSVGDELVVVGVPEYRTQTVTKAGNTYVTVMLYSTEVKFKDGVHEVITSCTIYARAMKDISRGNDKKSLQITLNCNYDMAVLI